MVIKRFLSSPIGLHPDVLDIHDAVLVLVLAMEVFYAALVDDFLLAEKRKRDLGVNFYVFFYL